MTTRPNNFSPNNNVGRVFEGDIEYSQTRDFFDRRDSSQIVALEARK